MILVTGATGFIGSAVLRRLTMKGHAVRALSRTSVPVPGAQKTIALPAPGSGPAAWIPLLDGVKHVVHCAGIAHSDAKLPESEYQAVNAQLTGELASAAASCIPGKLVFLSSIRAVTGPVSDEVVTENIVPRPEDAYGRSKLEGERLVRNALRGTERFTILRPVLVYGSGARGNLAALLRLARFPSPLPLAGLSAKRSLLDVTECAAAVDHVLFSDGTNGATYNICDRQPISAAEIIAAFRRGLGRPEWLFPLPGAFLSSFSRLLGQQESWRRISGPLIASSAELEATGWTPIDDSRAGLERIASNAIP